MPAACSASVSAQYSGNSSGYLFDIRLDRTVINGAVQARAGTSLNCLQRSLRAFPRMRDRRRIRDLEPKPPELHCLRQPSRRTDDPRRGWPATLKLMRARTGLHVQRKKRSHSYQAEQGAVAPNHRPGPEVGYGRDLPIPARLLAGVLCGRRRGIFHVTQGQLRPSPTAPENFFGHL